MGEKSIGQSIAQPDLNKETTDGAEESIPPQFSAHVFRHGKARYASDARMLASDNPQGSFDAEDQVTPDMSEQAQEAARIEANKFFDGLDSRRDALFFATSKVVRAIETADIFRRVAKERGFEILDPGKTGTELANQIGEGELRIVDALSADYKNTLYDNIFMPQKNLPPINWEAVNEETKQKWEEAKAIVDNDDKGSWGANLKAHADAVQAIIPEVETIKDLFEKKFQKMVRLIEWGEKKFQATASEKNIRVLGFGHEGSLMEALEKYFHAEGIKNCESISFAVNDESIKAQFRGDEALVEKK